MNEAIINNEITLRFRDGFGLMSADELKKHFGVSENNWGIHDCEQHTIVSFAWNRVGGFLAWLADPKGIAAKIEHRMRENLRGFERTSDLSADICGAKAVGFTFEYIANDADIKQVGKILSFRIGKCFYVIHFVTRAENEQEAFADFETMLTTAALRE